MEGQGPVQALQQVLERAVAGRVPDVHVEPDEAGWRVQFRREGRLWRVTTWNGRMGQEIVRRVKLLSRMDIAEKRIPQDGQLQLPVGGNVCHMRVATLPTVKGERLVIRIHHVRTGEDPSESDFGDDPVWRRWLAWTESAHGLLLIAGPTGSGKTTSLYRVVRRWAAEHRCVVTLEDPVEQHVEGVHQVEVQTGRGWTYRRLLPACLRQDPNAVAIGEIRDEDAARAAVQAALAGCLVVATVHGAGPAEVWSRFRQWGVPEGELESTLLAILSQRLVGRLCSHCRRRSGTVRGSGGQAGFAWTAIGCDACQGRGIAGVLPLFHLSEQGRDRPWSISPDWEESAWPRMIKGELGEPWCESLVGGVASVSMATASVGAEEG
ncbi:ATPase, T2SS/T4P/T4SS family [Kyrpidia sp.]|uniref:GspE/PulE family protein n=1 Tax=Kyrpidia sp. TaxID=2073077 RepID=UPI00258DFA83|nr:ATPase, T2SS/T4P/T4SS family [Kyrpidia sp.]MCL6577356.1 Flp pilus assembly complex ATPase component TadA [Kyrpidia sp.]